MRKKFLALLLSLCMLMSLTVTAAAAEYTDADAIPDWAQGAVDRWTDAGIMEAEEDGTFNSEHQLTRGEAAVLLCKLMGYSEMADRDTFTDLPEDKEQAEAILKLAKAGIMLGNGHKVVDPDGTLTREQMALMVFRALNMKVDPNAQMAEFADADSISPWAREAVATMAAKKMLEGDGTNLAPVKDIVKCEMAVLMDKMVAVYVDEKGNVSTTTVEGSGVSAPNARSIDTGTSAGAVILKSSATIKNAPESGAVVVAPAAGSTTTLTVTGAAGDITVAAEGARVTLNKGAEVGSVTAAAENNKVTVNKGAEVGAISAEAPKANLEVSGTVGAVAVAEGADKTTITAKTGAKVDSVTTSAEGVKVNGANKTIGTVVADAGSAEIKAKGAEVTNSGADSVKVDNKVVAAGDSKTSSQTGSNTSDYTGGGTYVPPTPTTPSHTLTIVKGAQSGANTSDITSVKVNGTESASSSVTEGSTVTVTVTSKRQIAVGLVYTGNTTAPTASYTTSETSNFVANITFTMPSVDADLVIVVMEACNGGQNIAVGVKPSACNAGTNDAFGSDYSGLIGTQGTGGSGEETAPPSEDNTGDNAGSGGEGGNGGDAENGGGGGTEGGSENGAGSGSGSSNQETDNTGTDTGSTPENTDNNAAE